MKILCLCLTAALLCTLSASAAQRENRTFFSSAARHSSFVSSESRGGRHHSTSSLLYTDGAGRLTAFDMKWEAGVITITIRQDGAVAWRRSWPQENASFSVSRREENGRVYFLITAGDRILTAEPDGTGAWDVRSAGENRQAVPL